MGSGDPFQKVSPLCPWGSEEVVFFITCRSPMELTQGSETQTPTVVSADPSKSVFLGSLGEWRGGVLLQT